MADAAAYPTRPYLSQASRGRSAVTNALNLDTLTINELHDEPRSPQILHLQRNVLDRGDDLVLVGSAVRSRNQVVAPSLRNAGDATDAGVLCISGRTSATDENIREVYSPDSSFASSPREEASNGSFSPGTPTTIEERPRRTTIRRGTGSFIDRAQLVIESDCEPEEATFDQLKAWLNRDRKIIYTPAPEEQIRAYSNSTPSDYESCEDNFWWTSNIKGCANDSHFSGGLPAPSPRDGHVVDIAGLNSVSLEHDVHVHRTTVQGNTSLVEITKDHETSSFCNFPGESRRSIVFRGLEELFFESLPRSRKFRWKELQETMKIYPFTIHYAIQALEYLATITLPLSYLTRTFNGLDYESFMDRIVEWASWTVLEAIARHDEIKVSLIEVLTHVEVLAAYATEIPLARVWSQTLRECLMHDRDDIMQVVDTILILGDKAIDCAMRLTTEERNTIMNVLQTLIDRQVTNHRFCERFLQKLVRRSGQLPGYLIIGDVEKHGTSPVGGGGFSDVWQGILRNRLVAMKVLRLFNVTDKERRRIQMDYCTESMLWRQLKHRNVLPFYGVAVDAFAPLLAMISPWLENGCVIKYLKEIPTTNRREMIIGIASGLRYLHALKPLVVHGDLRGANVLIDDQGQPRLADFGLAQFLDSQASCAGPSFRGGGALRWQAPELLASSSFSGISNPCQVTTCTDVYAFGILCWEIFTLEIPFFGLRDGDVVLRVVQKERPPRPPDHAGKLGLSDGLWKLVVSCWDHYPQRRPNMDVIVQKLTAGTTINNGHIMQSSGLDLQKVDVFHIPETTVVLPSIDSVLSSRSSRSLRSRTSSTTLTPVSLDSPWWNESEL